MSAFRDYLGLFRSPISRRSFLKLGAFATALTLSPGLVRAGLHPDVPTEVKMDVGPDVPLGVNPDLSPDRSISLYSIRTGERFDRVYWSEGKFVPQALEEINYFLRDYRTNEVKAIDPDLLDVLYSLSERIGTREPFHVISGYRSPQTNAMLYRRNKRLARGSLHIEGKAIDIRLPDCKSRNLRSVAWEMQSGGVGYYPRRDFVHVDTGRVRRWQK